MATDDEDDEDDDDDDDDDDTCTFQLSRDTHMHTQQMRPEIKGHHVWHS